MTGFKTFFTVWIAGLLAAPSAFGQAGVYRRHKDPQQLQLLDSGMASLKKRLDMINSAKKTIEAEYFIYSLDSAGRLFTQALIKKAKQGVKVRIIVDTSFTVLELDDAYARALNQAGIELRFYNPNVMLQIVSMQYRSHRKSLIVDGVHAITGGRNIADEYFDLDPEYNFMDSDLYVRGTIAKDIQASFNEFWNAKITKSASKPISILPKAKNDAKIADFITPNNEDKKLLARVNDLGGRLLKNEVSTTCYDTSFVADFPGKGEKTRVLRDQIIEEVKTARREVHIESPYFVVKSKTSGVLNDLLARKVQVKILTNSLYSTDAFYTQAALTTRMQWWVDRGVEFWFHNGENDRNYPLLPEVKESRWGTHSKRAVFDGTTTLIGTFNVDPRSANLNAEMAIMCRENAVLGEAVIRNMERMMARANKIGDGSDLNSNRDKIPLTKRLSFWLTLPLSNIFDFLL